ncbi:YkgJ family cysteine cluster protein [Archaeoglobus profundus]|nr:YkgJ family cysteine cluster protein [Archaeoglobus profundus]
MYAECVVRGLKVRIPFVCRMCGECCKKLSKVVYDPKTGKVYVEGIELDCIDGLDEFKEFSHPIKVPCPFLKDNKCTIHEIRPKSCREYPLLTGDLGVNCPALRSFNKFLKAFNPDKVEYKVDEKDIKPVKIPMKFYELFISLEPSKEELAAFLKLNELEKNLNLELSNTIKGP